MSQAHVWTLQALLRCGSLMTCGRNRPRCLLVFATSLVRVTRLVSTTIRPQQDGSRCFHASQTPQQRCTQVCMDLSACSMGSQTPDFGHVCAGIEGIMQDLTMPPSHSMSLSGAASRLQSLLFLPTGWRHLAQGRSSSKLNLILQPATTVSGGSMLFRCCGLEISWPNMYVQWVFRASADAAGHGKSQEGGVRTEQLGQDPMGQLRCQAEQVPRRLQKPGAATAGRRPRLGWAPDAAGAAPALRQSWPGHPGRAACLSLQDHLHSHPMNAGRPVVH